MKFEKDVHEAANQFDAQRYREVRATYDIDSNTLECDRLRHKLNQMSEVDTDELPSLESDAFVKVGEDKYLQAEIAEKVKILEAIVAEQIAEEEKEVA